MNFTSTTAAPSLATITGTRCCPAMNCSSSFSALAGSVAAAGGAAGVAWSAAAAVTVSAGNQRTAPAANTTKATTAAAAAGVRSNVETSAASRAGKVRMGVLVATAAETNSPITAR